MSTSVFNEGVVKQIEDLLNGKNEVYLTDPTLQAKIGLPERSELARKGYVIKHDSKSRLPNYIYRKESMSAGAGTAKAVVKKERRKVEYIMPLFTDEIKGLFACAKDWAVNRSVNLRFVGPHVSGKTIFANLIAPESGFSRVYQINGHADMDSSSFLGEKTVVVDKATSQNYIKYQKGILELAMIEGLELDENGDAKYDADGMPKVIGKPAMLFIDEYAAIPEHISIVLNRVMEIPPAGNGRRIEISGDMARRVVSHPGFCLVLSGNTYGKGCESGKTSGYTAQDIQQDDSTLDRISATYEFGYSLDAERMYIEDAIDDDVQVTQFIKFVEDIRKERISENVMTLLSTRAIVNICQLAKSFKSVGMKNAMVTAIYRSVFSGLREVERDAWAEKLNIYFAYDVRQLGRKDKNVFYL